MSMPSMMRIGRPVEVVVGGEESGPGSGNCPADEQHEDADGDDENAGSPRRGLRRWVVRRSSADDGAAA
jgi:hypothetical protein